MASRIYSKIGAVLLALSWTSSAEARFEITTESGVMVTRGVVAPKTIYTDDQNANLLMSLPKNYRGTVFGQRKLLQNGQMIDWNQRCRAYWFCRG